MTDQYGPAVVPSDQDGQFTRIGVEADDDRVVPRKQIFSWALWDWSTQPFNSVILTFIFVALYLTTSAFLPADIASLPHDDPRYEAGIAGLTSGLGLANTIAGTLIALIAPVMGQRSDGSGRRKFQLAIYTGVLVLCMALLFFVQSGPGFFFVLGVSLVAIGSVFSELAGVNYNAMLLQVSTRRTVGRVSGLGWGFGYLGGIVALIIVIVAYSFDWFGLPTADGLPFRVVAIGCAVWTIVFSIPIFLNVPELPKADRKARVTFIQSYVLLFKDIARIYRDARTTFWFLLASAVFRDGLAGVFAYGAVIASAVFGFGFLEVVIFGIAANVVAGVSTILSGRFDDRFGPKAVILTSLIGLVVSGLAVFFLRDSGDITFWIGGLVLCAFVGPAQAASRSFLARIAPPGHEGEVFGLYATTGRAASFLSPGLWTLLIAVLGATYWGILGIVVVILIGLVLMLFVRDPRTVRTPAIEPR